MRNCLLSHPNLHVSTLDAAQNDATGITPLCLASYLGKTEMMELLLEDGRVNVDGADNKNATPLMYAARDGNAVNVKLLLQHDASPDVTDDHGWSALQWGAGNQEIVLLCEEALRSRRPEVSLPISSTQYVKYPTNYTRLYSLINSLPLFSSSLSHLELNGLPSPPEDEHDIILSSYDLQKIQAALLVAIKAHDHLSIQSLLLSPPIPPSLGQKSQSATILVNHHDTKTGLTPLHHAIRSKPLPSLETITMLFQAGADINAQSSYGRTALHHLCRFGVDKDSNVWGIQKGGQNTRGDSKRHRRPQTESNGSSMTNASTKSKAGENDVQEGKSRLDESYRLSMQSGVSSRSSASEGRLSYISNESTKNSESICSHVELNSDVDPTVNACRHLARCASLLIKLGALVNHPDPTGNTPLHFAAEFGGVVEVIDVLVREGNANITSKNKRGLTPLDVVRSDAAKKALEVLLKEVAQEKISPLNGINLVNQSNDHATSMLSRSTLRGSTRNAFKRHSSIVSPTEVTALSKALRPLVLTGQPTKLDHIIHIPQTVEELRSQFSQILQNLFYYLTTGTASIEGLLANITELVVQPANQDSNQQRRHFSQLKTSIDSLRTQLEQTYALFDITDEQHQSVLVWYQQDMDGIEAFSMELWERCEVEREHIEVIYDAYEKLCDRVKDLECDNDQLARHIEHLRRKGNRNLEKACKSVTGHDVAIDNNSSHMENIQYLMGAITILEFDNRRHPSISKVMQQRNLLHEFESLISDHSEQVNKELEELASVNEKHSSDQQPVDRIEYLNRLQEAQNVLMNRWKVCKEKVEKQLENGGKSAAPSDRDTQDEELSDYISLEKASHSSDDTACYKSKDTRSSLDRSEETVRELAISPSSVGKEKTNPLRSEKPQKLNHLELTFDILMSNLHEIEKDIYEADKRIHQILSSKRNIYENRLDLEDQLNTIDKIHSPDQLSQRVEELRVGKSEVADDEELQSDSSNGTRQQVRTELSAILDQTAQLFEEQQRLISERATLDNEHQEKRAEIEDIKAEIGLIRPAELLSGLLERLETDESSLVTIQKDWKEDVECVNEVIYEEDTDNASNPDNETMFGIGCIQIRCRLVQLESSLHTLKITCESQLQTLKAKLSQTQAILLQAERELSQGRDHLNFMVEDLSDVQRQVFNLKRELEIVIQHRKEEIIKVWEVVNDVREGVFQNYASGMSVNGTAQREFPPQQKAADGIAIDQDQQELIFNELEQYHLLHESLLNALEQQRKDQTKISSQVLPNLINVLQAQQKFLMESDKPSIMETTLTLGELIDSIRMRELEKPAVFSDMSSENEAIRSALALLKRSTSTSARASASNMDNHTDAIGAQQLPRHVNSIRRHLRGGFGLPFSTRSRSSLQRTSNMRNSLLSDAPTLSTLASGDINASIGRPGSNLPRHRGRMDSHNSRSIMSIISPENSIAMSPTLTSSWRQDGTRASLISTSSISSLSSLHQANMLQKASRLKAANASKRVNSGPA
ncbi:hypothetical protein VKS41_001872 [Umbelopsis sp. WA50703]